jgi:hypothetical protein
MKRKKKKPFCESEYSTEYSTSQKYHHHHRRRRRRRVAIMELGHLLNLSGLTYPKPHQTIPILQPTRRTCYLKLFILVKRSTCFGRSFRPSSGAQNCVYSNGICQTATATCC